ncbi:MAG: hypothetical protein NTV87_11030, partial [Ignavibacteriae bacterium]|nr:hypothetical protein [Ignavibacteriota bacterium]
AFDKAIELKSDWAEPYFEKARILLINEKNDEGFKVLDKAFGLSAGEKLDTGMKNDRNGMMRFLEHR